MAMKSIQVTCTAATATIIPGAVGTSLSDRVTCVVKTPTATIYLGGPDVTATNGMPIGLLDAIALDLGPGDQLYAFPSAGTPTFQVLLNRQPGIAS